MINQLFWSNKLLYPWCIHIWNNNKKQAEELHLQGTQVLTVSRRAAFIGLSSDFLAAKKRNKEDEGRLDKHCIKQVDNIYIKTKGNKEMIIIIKGLRKDSRSPSSWPHHSGNVHGTPCFAFGEEESLVDLTEEEADETGVAVPVSCAWYSCLVLEETIGIFSLIEAIGSGVVVVAIVVVTTGATEDEAVTAVAIVLWGKGD